MATFLILDISNIVCRAYYSVATMGLPEANTIALAKSRFLKMVSRMIEDSGAIRLMGACDVGRSFRHALSSDYKASRTEKPAALEKMLFEAPRWLADTYGCENYMSPDHEADDVIATIADQCLSVGGIRLLIVSNDGDALSSIHDAGDGTGVFVLRNKQGAYQLWGPAEVLAAKDYGVPPARVPLFKALSGDTSDGIKGIPGIGPVAARRIVARYPNVRRVYAALDDARAFTKAERERLSSFGLEAALVQEQLARPVRSAPLALYG